jgi:hypothetical protein
VLKAIRENTLKEIERAWSWRRTCDNNLSVGGWEFT